MSIKIINLNYPICTQLISAYFLPVAGRAADFVSFICQKIPNGSDRRSLLFKLGDL